MNIKLILIGIVILLFSIVILIPVDDCDNTACQLEAVMPLLAAQQKHVDNIEQSKLTGYEIKQTDGLLRGFVSSNGEIIIVLTSGSVLISKKSRRTKDLFWDCKIFPEKFNNLSIVKDCAKIFYKSYSSK